MIVRAFDGRLQLITQPDHAQLAGRIMAHCTFLESHPRREAVLRAIAAHDNGWIEEDASPTVHPDTGEVVDFVTAPLAVRHAVWPRGVSRLASDPWVAALVAQHAITVYDRFRTDREWDSFFARMEGMCDDLLREANCSADELPGDYAFVRLGDLISLTFCTGWRDEQKFGRWTVRLSDDRVIVAPSDFAAGTIPFEILATEIPNRKYRTQAELSDVLRSGTPVALSGEVTAGS